jgi:hypothetical protein
MTSVLTMPWAIPTIFGCLVAMVAIVANVTAATIKANAETNLKKRMIEQGYSAAEIERVIRASGTSGHAPCREYDEESPPRKPPKKHPSMV